MTATLTVRTILLAATIAAVSVGSSIAEGSDSAEVDLARMLARLAASAEMYRRRALSFTCEETIRWNGKHDDGRRKFGYVVVHDEQTGFEDYRTRLKSGKRKRVPKRVEPADYGVPAYLRSVYLWPFIFRGNRQDFHRYELLGSDEVLDRPAVMIRFEPLAPYREGFNDWFGTAWVDRETAQLLRVEARHADQEQEMARLMRHRAGDAVSSWTYRIEQVTTEFTVEEHGMRLPGKVELTWESYDMLRTLEGFDEGRRLVLWVVQTYRTYRFFGVESDAYLQDPAVDKP